MIANTFNNYFVDVISVLTKSICLDIPCIALMDAVLSKCNKSLIFNIELLFQLRELVIKYLILLDQSNINI